MVFRKEIGEIYRLQVPFMSVYTSVFLVRRAAGHILVDCATTAEDVERYIIPALRKMGIALSDIRYLFLTHGHSDHAGGKDRIRERHPEIQIVSAEAPAALSPLEIYPLPGHTPDSIGLFDPESGTLISGDGLQGAGIGMFRCSLAAGYAAYSESIARIKADARIKNILFSHAYEPWYSNGAFGREEVEKRLADCPPCAIKEMRASEERK